jgi:hypothetical protein
MELSDFMNVKKGDSLYLSELDRGKNLRVFKAAHDYRYLGNGIYGVEGQEEYIGMLGKLVVNKFTIIESYIAFFSDPKEAMLKYIYKTGG